MPDPFVEISSPDVRFVADAHFRHLDAPAERERRQRFVAFLESVPSDAVVFLLGDIFDFYFEYRSVVSKRYVDLYPVLAATSARGVRLHFLGGNHDHWVGRFAEEYLGMRLHRTEILIAVQGRRVVCAHGDLIMPRDWGYKMLKTVLRNRAVVAASRWIHPDLLDAVASGVADGSRWIKRASQEPRARRMADWAHARFFTRGNDVFVMGHVHHPLLDVREGREFMIVGDWIRDFTYGRLSGGTLSLETFTDAGRY